MNSENLLEIIGEARENYVLSALESRNGKMKAGRHPSANRMALIAAVIALLLLLVGCVAGFLRLQDMSIGQEQHTENFDDQGKTIDPTEITRDIITFYGHSGAPVQLAVKEWYQFLEKYDPDNKLMTNDADLPDIPNRYEYTYGCYTAEMVAKVDEISEKYHLKLLETEMLIQTYQSDIFMDDLGIVNILPQNEDAEIKNVSAVYYPPYNFCLDFSLNKNGVWNAALYYSRKDYFPAGLPGGIDLSSFEQWDYTAPDGAGVLLALSDKGVAYIVHEQENAMLTISVDGNRSDSRYPGKEEILTKEQLEAIADSFNYSVILREVNLELLKEKLNEAEQTYRDTHAYVPEKYADFNDYLMRTVRHQNPDILYAFYDLTGDGKNELLIGQDGGYTSWISIENGQAVCHDGILTYLCAGGVREEVSYHSDSKYEKHCYFAPVNDAVIINSNSRGDIITVLTYKEGEWYQGKEVSIFAAETIPQENVEYIMQQYPRIQLQWKSLITFPLNADGLTVGEYVEQYNTKLNAEELHQVYADFIMNISEEWYTHYRIMDINSDGVEDLLLSGDGERFWCAYTYHYGNLVLLNGSEFYLCDNGIVEHCGIDLLGIGVELEVHKYVRYSGYDCETIGFAGYNKATAKWQSDRDGTVISEAEAQAIIARYPRIDQEMRPISELLNR